jgi:peptide/nickel transport system substrate-binding protein
VLPAPEVYASTANDACLTQDIPGAIALLDEAGIVDTDGDGIREYEGTPLSVLYQTSTNAVRQDTQALIKQWWSRARHRDRASQHRRVGLLRRRSGIPGHLPEVLCRHRDVHQQLRRRGPGSLHGQLALLDDIPGPETQWQGSNIQRFCMPEYDALVAEMAGTADLEERGRLAREMNDMIIQGYSIIPLIHRGGQSARAVTVEGVKMSDWDSELWNIAEWTRTPGAERE